MVRAPAIVAAISLAFAVPAAAAAGDGGRGGGSGGDEARVRTVCFGGPAELRLRSDERDNEGGGKIEVELRLDARSRGVQTWRMVVLHERTIVYRGSRRSTGPSYSLRLRLNVPDWRGRETVTARIANGTARTCVVETTI